MKILIKSCCLGKLQVKHWQQAKKHDLITLQILPLLYFSRWHTSSQPMPGIHRWCARQMVLPSQHISFCDPMRRRFPVLTALHYLGFSVVWEDPDSGKNIDNMGSLEGTAVELSIFCMEELPSGYSSRDSQTNPHSGRAQRQTQQVPMCSPCEAPQLTLCALPA